MINATGPVHQPHDLRIRVVVVGQRVAQAHIPKAGDQNFGHLTAPEVMPRISWHEKMT